MKWRRFAGYMRNSFSATGLWGIRVACETLDITNKCGWLVLSGMRHDFQQILWFDNVLIVFVATDSVTSKNDNICIFAEKIVSSMKFSKVPSLKEYSRFLDLRSLSVYDVEKPTRCSPIRKLEYSNLASESRDFISTTVCLKIDDKGWEKKKTDFENNGRREFLFCSLIQIN